MERLVSFLGIFVLLGIGYACSTHRGRVPWRIVVVGILLQAYLALFLVRPEWVPVALTVSAAVCLLVLLTPRPPFPLPPGMDEFFRLTASGLGLLGALTLAWWIGAWALVPAGALLLLHLLRPAARRPLTLGLALLGCGAAPALVWTGALPHDFVFGALDGIGTGVEWVVEFAGKGVDFVFGGLARKEQSSFVFAIDVGAIILLFSALMSALYYLRVLPWLVGGLARLLHRGLGVSGAESLAAASNIFIGQTEAPLVIRPYLDRMTKSEIMALMSGGFATIAGSVFGVYVIFLRDAGLQHGPAHLIAASVMSAPASFVLAKLFVPETEQPETAHEAVVAREELGTSFLDALSRGVTAGVRLAVNVAAMLLVFYALIAMLDTAVGWAAGKLSPGETVTFRELYAYAFAPFAWLMGVPSSECLDVGQLLGTKTIFNEFFAYLDLKDMIVAGKLSTRSAVLSTYALCGFANFMSIGIQIGGLSALAEGRRADFARLAFRAMVAGALACQLTACIVGVIGAF